MALMIVPDFSAGELAPSLQGRVDTAEYRKGLKTARNCFVLPFGGVTNRPGTIFCGPVKDHANPPRLIKFQFKTTDTYIIEMGAEYMRFLRNGYHVVETPVTITDITEANPGVVTAAAHGFSNGDEVILTGFSGMTELNGRRAIVASVTTDTFALTSQFDGSNIDTTNYTPYVSGGQVARIYEIATPYAYADLDRIKFVQSADVITLVHPDYDPRNLSRTGHTAWSLDVISFVPAIGAPANLTVTPQGTTGATTYNYRVSAIEDQTFVEGPYSSASTATGNATLTATNYNQITWDAVSGAFRYNIYKEEGGIYGFLATSETNAFDDIGTLAPNFEQTPREAVDPFDGADNDPGAVGFYQQRKVYGNTNNAPDTIWFSVIADFDNFSRAFPSQADDAFQVTMDQRQINEIRHFLALDDLLVFTSGAEWRISGGLDAGFSLETFRQRPQSDWGCSHIEPILIGKTVLFVQDRASNIRSFGYDFASDGFSGSNLTVLARHLFIDRTIRDWTYSAIPNTIIYACRDDGVLLNLTFNQEQSVIAWTHSDTPGMFHSSETIPNLSVGEDVSYFVVKRHINGEDVAFIERFHTRKWPDIRDNMFLDASLTLDGPVEIEGIAVDGSGVVTITATDHPFMDGEEVDLSDIVWEPNVDEYGDETQPYPALNNGRFVVGDAAADTFVLYDIDNPSSTFDGSSLPNYVGGGYIRCCVDRIFGLHHLAGHDVFVMADAKQRGEYTVTAEGVVEFDGFKASRVHVGLKYLTDIELLDFDYTARASTFQGHHKRIPSVTLRLEDTVNALVGPDKNHLTRAPWRTTELMFDPDAPFTGDKHIVFAGKWGKRGSVFIRQDLPYPITLAAVMPDIDVAPAQIG